MSAHRHQRPLRIAVVTALYPNREQPRHGIFVEERLRALVATGEVEARVVAPVPWFWSTHPRYGRYARMAAVAAVEYRQGLEVRHPRYLVVPRVGMTLGPASMAVAAGRALAEIKASGFDFDLIDSHYFYPDGVAAARLAQRFRRPFTITARGADLNTIAEMRVPRRQIQGAIARADGLITVSRSLAAKLIRLGADPARIQTLRNGVDLTRFAPLDRDRVRQTLGVSGAVWLCVGHLIERKGVHFALDALAQVPNTTLVIAGDGPDEAALRAQAARLGVASRVRFAGAIVHDALPAYYNAADALILATGSEGMPNVVLEALACGTAVIANPVDGIPEIMTEPLAGRLLQARTGQAIVAAWQDLRANELADSGRAARRRYAERFGWQATTRGQLDLFARILAARGQPQVDVTAASTTRGG